MDFKLEDNERTAMIEILTGKLMYSACKDNNCSYDRMSKYKNKLFPQFKSKRKYAYTAEDAPKFLDFAITSLKVRKPEQKEQVISAEQPTVSPEAMESLRKHVASQCTEDNATTIYLDVAPLKRMNPEAFNKVMRLAEAAQTMESVSGFLKDV